ncbi:MAG: sulfatase [Crocinitomicaceae bacterium]|jgi:glucan phosphoethanolaminetransferase (alkaline phosphatase superfamily)|nr:sulfatase [Crocinitomicaceae bacterium]
MLKYLKLLLIPLICIGIDVSVRAPLFYLYTGWQLFFYLLSVVVSLSFFVLCVILFSKLKARKFLFNTLILLFVLFLLISFVGSFLFYFINGFFPNYYTLLYFRTEPASAFVLLKDSMHLRDILLFLAVGVPVFWWVRRLSLQEYKLSGSKLLLASGRLLVLYFFLWIYHKKFDQCLIVDANLAISLQRHILDKRDYKTYQGEGHGLRSPFVLGKSKRQPKFNVLVVIFESMRKDRMQAYGYQRETTPNFEKFRLEHADDFYVFDRPYTVSTTTMLAVPAILTGIGPYQEKEILYTQPMIWDYAKMMPYRTFFASSHTMQWYRFNNFYASEKLNSFWSSEDSGKEFFNDLGIDDKYTVRQAVSQVRKSGKQPFFGVLQLNATHYPYHIPEGFGRWSPSFSDGYDNAVLYQDLALKELFEGLEKSGKIDNTVIFFVSDHGESLKDHNNIGHVDSYYNETVSIPLMVYLPEKIAKGHDMRAFIENKTKITSNIDIAPTIIDLLQLQTHPQVKSILPNFTGYSLFRKIPAGREVISMNNNDIARFRVGVSLVKGNYHYLWRVNVVPNREELYNLKYDPAEEHNLLDVVPRSKVDALTKNMRKYPVCRKFLRKYERF